MELLPNLFYWNKVDKGRHIRRVRAAKALHRGAAKRLQVTASLAISPLQMADRSNVRLVKQVLGTLHAGYSAEISNGLVATMASVETDTISIGILYREIMMAV
jgi:hypothetical protein